MPHNDIHTQLHAPHTRINRFKSDWFHRLAGFSLDLMAVAAISSMRFDYYKKARRL